MTEYLLCIDPGKSTGVALLVLPHSAPARILHWDEVPGNPMGVMSVFRELEDFLSRDIIVVMEDWDSRKLKFVPDARHACYPAGMVQMLCHQKGVKVDMRRPFTRTKIPDTQKALDPLGYWLPGDHGGKGRWHGHARQALRHGLSHAIHTQKHLPTTLHVFPRTV